MTVFTTTLYVLIRSATLNDNENFGKSNVSEDSARNVSRKREARTTEEAEEERKKKKKQKEVEQVQNGLSRFLPRGRRDWRRQRERERHNFFLHPHEQISNQDLFSPNGDF